MNLVGGVASWKHGTVMRQNDGRFVSEYKDRPLKDKGPVFTTDPCSRIPSISPESNPSDMQTSATSAYHTFMDYSSTAGPGRFIVPQQVFSPPSAVTPTFREPIRFSAQGNAGVNLRDVSTPSYSGLMNADQPVSLGANTIFICIHWPGYTPLRRSIPLDKTGGRLTYKMLALIIATTVQGWMMDVHQRNIQSIDPSKDWHVEQVKFESLWLLELRQISTGLWQPVLLRDV